MSSASLLQPWLPLQLLSGSLCPSLGVLLVRRRPSLSEVALPRYPVDSGACGRGVCGYSSWGHKELAMTEQLTV